ncbi:MAG: DNA polymerase III subunit delta [Chthoniobacterales bacterium]
MSTKSVAKSEKSCHFLTGSDESEVKRHAQQMAAELSPEGSGDFGLETIDGAVDNVDQAVTKIEDAIQALLTVPFFGGKLVWLKNASFFSDGVIGRSETVQGSIERLLECVKAGLPSDVKFLISAPEADKRRTFYKSFTKLAEVQVFDKPDIGFGGDESALIDFVAQRARDRELRFSEDALETFVARASNDTRQIDNELEKLILFIGMSREIMADDIREVVPTTREGGIFDLSNAIAKRNLALAFQTLTQLLRQGESAVGLLLAAIVPTVRNLLMVKDLIERNRLTIPAQAHHFSGILSRLPAAATSHLPRKKDGSLNAYPLGIAAVNCRRFSLAELRDGFDECFTTNVQLISSQTSEAVVLQRLLFKLLAKIDK